MSIPIHGLVASEQPPAIDVASAVARATEALFREQKPDGYWWAELESNVTITAEVVLLNHVWGAQERTPRAAAERYFREQQCAHGGWELAFGDGGDLSVSIEAYMALRLLGVTTDDSALQRARAFIVARGGVSRSRIFTKMHLALVGAYRWAGLPALPPWLMLLPDRGPFSIYDLSSWARGSTVPLIALFDAKPVYGPPLDIPELFAEGIENATYALPAGPDRIARAFTRIDGVLKWFERTNCVPFRKAGVRRAEKWIVERQEATGDWAGIIPAMLNAMLALRVLNYDRSDPIVVRGFAAIDAFTITGMGDEYRVQPCISPVWDTGFAVRALIDAGASPNEPRLIKAASWLLEKQIVSTYGDWSVKNRAGKPGGWAFEFENRWYPDVDDSAVVVMALALVDHPQPKRVRDAIARAERWIATMQCSTGGWAAFDVDNDKTWLNRIPYGDLEAMIDPSTADVTARVLEMDVRAGAAMDGVRVRRAVDFLLAEQEADGAWFGRWGVNYVYGTSGVLTAFGPAGADERIDRAVDLGAAWLMKVQNTDGGWGEGTASYRDSTLRGVGPSTASQTAWGILGLLAAATRRNRTNGNVCTAIDRGIAYLLATQDVRGSWAEREFTGTGFPVHFYLNYHQYRLHFPLQALGRYASWRASLHHADRSAVEVNNVRNSP